MSTRKIFAGARLRSLRNQQSLTQKQLAVRLGISTSYLNQIENNQRPLTAALLVALGEYFALDLSDLISDKSDRVTAALREAFADPVFGETAPGLIETKNLAAGMPDSAQSLLRLYDAYRKASERLASVDAAMQSSAASGLQTAYEEVRDFFHFSDNYIDPLDHAAEALSKELGGPGRNFLHRLIAYFEDSHAAQVRFVEQGPETLLRRFDRTSRALELNARLAPSAQTFQLAAQLALMEQRTLIAEIVAKAGFETSEAENVGAIGLANYFAGALLLPYEHFRKQAEALGYDIEELAYQFGASREQVAHRLSSLQRPNARGVPFFFARVDAAGTITKRHSAAPLQFARFGGACPLWNVHRAFEGGARIDRQLAETPDGRRYISLAWSEDKRLGGHGAPLRRYAYALGCEIAHADRLVYARDLDLDATIQFDPIGVGCRICERANCPQRSVPPIAANIEIDTDQRGLVPYRIR